MKQQNTELILFLTFIVGTVLVLLLLSLPVGDLKYRGFHETAARVYATNTEAAVQTMTATFSVKPD